MADYPHPSSEGRAANMRANRRTDTKPELALRRALHQRGFRYRKDYRLDLEGGRRVRPDIAFTARKVAIFVDGCFWHACPEHGSKPRANEWYWGPKLLRNVERDRVNDAALAVAGWTVIRLWEHVPLDEAVATVVAALAATTGHRHPELPPPASPIRLSGHRCQEPTSTAPDISKGAAHHGTLVHHRTHPQSPISAPALTHCGRLWGTMRVYLPSTLPAAAQALRAGQVGPGPQPGFAVTPALREAYASGDEEELEYAALTEAARASLRLLADDPAAPARRVVLAAEVPPDQVRWDERDGEPGRVTVNAAVPVERLASGYVDDPAAGADVRSAAEALPAADAGDDDARFTVDGAEGHELGWYATQELSYLAE